MQTGTHTHSAHLPDKGASRAVQSQQAISPQVVQPAVLPLFHPKRQRHAHAAAAASAASKQGHLVCHERPGGEGSVGCGGRRGQACRQPPRRWQARPWMQALGCGATLKTPDTGQQPDRPTRQHMHKCVPAGSGR